MRRSVSNGLQTGSAPTLLPSAQGIVHGIRTIVFHGLKTSEPARRMSPPFDKGDYGVAPTSHARDAISCRLQSQQFRSFCIRRVPHRERLPVRRFCRPLGVRPAHRHSPQAVADAMSQEAPWRRRLAQLSEQISGAAAAGASTTYSAISSLTAGQANYRALNRQQHARTRHMTCSYSEESFTARPRQHEFTAFPPRTCVNCKHVGVCDLGAVVLRRRPARSTA